MLSDPKPASGELAQPFDVLREVQDYAIYLIDPQGRVLTWNSGAEQIGGYRASEILGENFSRFFTEDDRLARKPQQRLEQARREGRAQDEGLRVRKSGETFWADVVITAIHQPDGALMGFLEVTRDLTERRRSEDLSRQSEERFRLLIENVNDYAILMLDAHGKITTWGQGAQRMLGFTPQEVLGEHYSLFYPPELLLSQRPERELEIAATAGRYEEEGWRLRKNGERFKVNVVLTAIREPDSGRLRGFAKVLRDLTGPLQLQEQMRSANQLAEAERERADAAQAALQARDEFISVAAHELRTPLTALMLKLQLAEQSVRALPVDPTDAKTQRLASRVAGGLRQVERLSELVERLLDVSRIVRGRLSLSPTPTRLTELVRHVAEDFREAALEANVAVTVNATGEAAGLWDAARLEQVVVNLLANAIKYGAGKPVELTVEETPGEVTLSVTDHGVGIEAADVERIFSRFERASSVRHYGGLGLGLYICRNLVEAHGGELKVSSTPGVGSTFTARLPRRPPA